MRTVEPNFVNSCCETLPYMLEVGVIPTSPISFHLKVLQPLPAPLSTSAPSHQRARHVATASTPCCSARLAKKAMGHTPAVVAAQNILMKRLGLDQGPQL
jgi:hypothetical protein